MNSHHVYLLCKMQAYTIMQNIFAGYSFSLSVDRGVYRYDNIAQSGLIKIQ